MSGRSHTGERVTVRVDSRYVLIDQRKRKPTVGLVPIGKCASIESFVPRPDEILELHDLRADIDHVFAELTPKEAAIIRGRFGFDNDWEGYTLDELGKQFGVCRERIAQIERIALDKLRHPSRRKKLAVHVGLDVDEAAERASQRAACEAEFRAAEESAAQRIAQQAVYTKNKSSAQLDCEITKTGGRSTAKKKSAVQLDREIAEALGRSSRNRPAYDYRAGSRGNARRSTRSAVTQGN